MAKLILASVLCIFLLVKGTEAQEIGADCTGTSTCTDATATCDSTCKIKAGETCLADSTDCIAHAACDGDSLQCTCGDDYTVNGDSTQCEAKVGISCDANTPCVSGSTCDSTCKVNAGESCADGHTCVTSATCDGTTCNAKVGQTCSNTINCVDGAACDPADSKCKTKVDAGETCTPDSANKICNPDATATLTCDTTCKTTLEAGGDCSVTTSTRCNPDASPALTCVDDKCKTTLAVGGDCSNTDNTRCNPAASPALTCDSGKCRIKEGEQCTAGANANCVLHAECTQSTCSCQTDFVPNTYKTCVGTKEIDDDCSNDNCIPTAVCDGGKCKTKESAVNGSCSVASKAACDPDILACQSDKCKSKIGVDCVGTGDCVTGATCTQSKCSCSAGVVPSADKTQCGGAMGIAASMLLVVATFVTSRFL